MENEEVLSESSENKEILLKKDKKEKTKDVLSTLLAVIITVFVCRFVFTMHKIPSASMEPTIQTKSLAICWRFPYLIGNPTPKYEDVVSFKDPDSSVFLIKRVIGLPGDTISFDGTGKVFRNGKRLDEPYLKEQMSTFSSRESFTVPEGKMFVMGDNRQNSNDSRWKKTTFIPIENVYAKELFSFYCPILMPAADSYYEGM